MTRMTAPQQGRMAAGARSCSVLGGYLWNAPVATTVATASFAEFVDHTNIATKRPARHLGGLPT